MTHLQYIVATYLLAGLVIFGFAGAAWLRMAGASRRLAALDGRARR